MAVEDPTKKQTEQVDPEVAEILGLEDNFDLDQEEYITLLREKMTELDMKSSQVSSKGGDTKKISESQSLLIDEFKRVKKLKGSTFTAPKKTVNPDSFFGRKKEDQEQKQKPITNIAKLLSGSGSPLAKYKPPEEPQAEQEEKKDDSSEKISKIEDFLNGSLLDIVKDIRKLTEDILSILTKQSAVNKKGAELFRREGEKKGKKTKEGELEAKEEKKGLGLVEKITKPFTSIFDTIKKFIMNVLLGSLVNWLFSVLQNPRMLLKPIQGLIDGVVGFFNTVIQFVDNMVVQPVRSFIDTINSALNGFIDILNGALKILPGSPQVGQVNIPNIPEPAELKGPDITGERKQQEQKPQGPAVNLKSTGGEIKQQQEQKPQGPPVNLKYTGGEIKQTVLQKVTGGVIESLKNAPVIQKITGGSISSQTAEQKKKWSFDDQVSREGGNVSSRTTSFDISGLGPDKHLTALSTGEYVLKKGAADWLGGPTYLDGINKMFGGSSERRVASFGDVKIKAMASGGEIGSPTISIQSPGPKGGGPGPRAGSTPSPSSLKLLATNAKTTYYDPSLGGINASGYKTKEGLPATSTGEGYRPNVFSAAAFPPMIAKLPSGNLARAVDFPGGKTVKKPLNVVVSNAIGKTAVVRINDVGPGVKGHSPNHMLDFSVASKNFLGTGTGYKIEGPTTNRPGPLNGTATAAASSGASISESSGSTESASVADSGSSSSTSTESTLSAADIAYSVKGDPAKESYLASLPPLSSLSSAQPAVEKSGPKGGPSSKTSETVRPGQNNKVSENLVAWHLRSLFNNPFNLTSRRSGQFGRYATPSQQIRTPSTAPRSSASTPTPTPTPLSTSRPLSKSSIATKPIATPTLDPKLTPMQNWAKLYPTLASKVKPGQSGYDEIQKVISPSSPAAPKIDPATGNIIKTTTVAPAAPKPMVAPAAPKPMVAPAAPKPMVAPAAPKIDPATGNIIKITTVAPAAPKPMVAPLSPQSVSIEKSGPKGQGNASVRPRGNNSVSQHPAAKFLRSTLSKVSKSISESWASANKVPELSSHSPRSSRDRKPASKLVSPTKLLDQNPLSTYSSADSSSPIKSETVIESPEVTKYMESAEVARKSKDQSQMDKVRDMGMGIWAKSNPKLAASLAERERTKGTSATTNPLMKDFKDRLPSPKAPSADIATKGFGLSSKGIELSKSSAFSSGVSFPKVTSSSFSSGFDLSSKGLELSKLSIPSTLPVASSSFSSGFDLSSKGLELSKSSTPSTSALPVSPSSITSPTKPHIPEPPQGQSNVTMLPLPSMPQGGKPQGSGITKTGTTPTVYFDSFNDSESTVVTTAALYNIWGM